MIILALTGSMAMGKTTVSRMFSKLGIPVCDSDQIVKDLYDKDQKLIRIFQKKYPYLIEDFKISKEKLWKEITKNPVFLKEIEKYVHPIVRSKTLEFIKKHRRQNRQIICLDIPLLFEKRIDLSPLYQIDFTICVCAPSYIQQRRILHRQKEKQKPLNLLLKKQMPDLRKKQIADLVIDTGLSKARTFAQVKNFVFDILKRRDMIGHD